MGFNAEKRSLFTLEERVTPVRPCIALICSEFLSFQWKVKYVLAVIQTVLDQWAEVEKSLLLLYDAHVFLLLFNPFKPKRISHSYQMYHSISVLRVVR